MSTTATLSGLNGFDFSSLITATIQDESAPLNALKTQQANLQSRDSALSSLGTQISQLETTVGSLASQTAFTNVAASSSDATIATATLGAGGIAGEYDVNVGNLAKAQLTASTKGYTNTTDIVADGGSISFTIGGQTTQPITISSGTQTSLADLAGQINGQNSGVFASVVNDGTNNKLAIMSRQTGLSNGFTINNTLTNSAGPGTVLAFAGGQSPSSVNSQNAVDASFTVNGLLIGSASNSPSNAIPGATLTLTKQGETTISVTSDYSAIQTTLNTLVSQYNSLQQFVTQQSASGGPLAGDPVARQVMKDIRSGIMAGNTNGGKYQYLAEVGLQFTQTGTLSLDQTSLNAAVNSPQDLQKLFQGASGSNGAFNGLLANLTNDDATAGMIWSTQSSDQTTIKQFTDQIASQQLRLDNRKAQLTKLYAAADQAMTSMRAASQSLSQLGGTSSLLGAIGQ
jgi:flagellar hook-associated protein 2